MRSTGWCWPTTAVAWFFQGEQNGRWPDRLIEDLKTIPAPAFVAVDTCSLMVDPDSAEAQ